MGLLGAEPEEDRRAVFDDAGGVGEFADGVFAREAAPTIAAKVS
jgi:hypothetical protein